MKFKSVKRRKVHEDVAQQIEDQILSGGLEEGATLPSERSLMEVFNVGRPAVRDQETPESGATFYVGAIAPLPRSDSRHRHGLEGCRLAASGVGARATGRRAVELTTWR